MAGELDENPQVRNKKKSLVSLVPQQARAGKVHELLRLEEAAAKFAKLFLLSGRRPDV